jgi:hypothetical protein
MVALPQELDGLSGIEVGHFDGRVRTLMRPRRVAAGDDDVPAGVGHQPPDLGLLGPVEDQHVRQLLPLQPGQHAECGLLGGGLVGHPQPVGQADQRGPRPLRAIGRHPPDHFVVVLELVQVLAGQLGLPDPADPVQHQR